MADPLSIAASVIAIATVFLQSSKALTEFVQDVKGAPEELRAIASDAKTFSAHVLAVKSSLAIPDIGRLVDRTEAIRGLMAVMCDAMQRCADACQALLRKLESHTSSTTTGLKLARDLGWVFKKKDILAAVQRLANTKLTLTTSYTSANLVIQLHTLVLDSGNASAVQIDPATVTSAGIDVASTLGRFRAASIRVGPESVSARSYLLAAEAGNVKLVEELLDQGVDVDSRFAEGHSALLLATARLDAPLIKLLLDRGADPLIDSDSLPTPLSIAVALGDHLTLPCMVAVLARRASHPAWRDNKGNSVLHLLMGAWGSEDDWHTNSRTLTDRGVSLKAGTDATDRRRLTDAQVDAARKMFLESLCLLLDSGADLNLRNASGDVPLGVLLREAGGRYYGIEVTQLLIDCGTHLDVQNSAGDSLLSSGLCKIPVGWDFEARVANFKLLLARGASASMQIRDGTTLIHALVDAMRQTRRRSYWLRRLLWEDEFSVEFAEILSLLVDDDEAHMSHADSVGRPPLAAIIMSGCAAWSRLFIECVAQPTVHMQASDRLDLALRQKEADLIVKLLCRADEDSGPDDEACDAALCEAVCWAVALDAEDLVKTLLGPMPCAFANRERTRTVQALDEAQKRYDSVSRRDIPDSGPIDTPLDVAARAGSKSMIRLLISYGFPIVFRADTYDDTTALDTAVQWQNVTAMQELLALGTREGLGSDFPWGTVDEDFGAKITAGGRRNIASALSALGLELADDWQVAAALGLDNGFVASADTERQGPTSGVLIEGRKRVVDANDSTGLGVEWRDIASRCERDMITWSPSGLPTCLNRLNLREGLERHWAASEWCQLYYERYVNVDWKAIAVQPEHKRIRELVTRDRHFGRRSEWDGAVYDRDFVASVVRKRMDRAPLVRRRAPSL
ncbi:hypothetical protein B0A48_16553 [Cryoendolithus antarcticus]|uniref:Azaphilone pigments biosynthesis cluster protein L N-terminal domain-containing protein n=1 Tax=Cryoendolithus antarcticus TaxID=1507870 RepID=A0A1V8SE05_9PEZI|nr:hypothetical protein B0A48_16553 [Cryoendolithus antarcticus]